VSQKHIGQKPGCSMVLDQKQVALSCNGASVMLGCRTGVGALLQHDAPLFLTFHCLAHRLELALKDMCIEVNLFDKNVNVLLSGVYVFYHKITLNRAMLKRCYQTLKEKGSGALLIPPRVGGMRWVGHTYAASAHVVGSIDIICL